MSIFRPRTFACPRCGAAITERVALTLNGGRHVTAREAIVARTFQRFSCRDCQAQVTAEGPLLYIDFTQRHWMMCFPRAWEGAWREVERAPEDTWRRNLVQHSPDAMRQLAGGFQVRAVFGLEALREKLVATAGGVDDVALELCKLDMLRQPDLLAMDPDFRPVLDAVTDGELHLVAKNPAAETDAAAPPTLRLAVPVDRLQRFAEGAGSQAWERARQSVTGGPYVDVGRLLVPGTASPPSSWNASFGPL